MMRSLACVLMVGALLMVACERPGADPAPPAPPAPPPAPAGQVEPPPLPAVSLISIDLNTPDERMLQFPAARLRVQKKDDEVRALLYSDDPLRRYEDQEGANSFYFEMHLDIESVAELHEAHWVYQAVSAERAETANGVFLDGWRKHLQPFQVQIVFEPHPDVPQRLIVHLDGQFLLFHTRDRTQSPRWTTVSARFVVRPEVAG